MPEPVPLIFRAFSSPNILKGLGESEWNKLIFQAYRVKQVARLYALLKHEQFAGCIPHNLLWHFTSAWQVTQAHARDYTYTLNKLAVQLSPLKSDIILLKGSAYALSETQAVSAGRLFSDIDIFVPQKHLGSTEQLLGWSGWQFDKQDEYDMGYYRAWMHELPPMSHPALPMSLDVHHHIVPIISRTAFALEPLVASVRDSAIPRFKILSAEAQLIHTAMHMLTNDDVTNISRDLLDFYLNYTAQPAPEFTANLIDLAQVSQTHTHVYRALRLMHNFFDIAFEEAVKKEVFACTYRDQIIDHLYRQLILGKVHNQDPNKFSYQQALLLVRAHYLKMPVPILLKHSIHKILAGLNKAKTDT